MSKIPKRQARRPRLPDKYRHLLDDAVAGPDDLLAQRARLVAAGKVDVGSMTAAEIWAFAEPAELFAQWDFGRSCPGHKDFDAAYHARYLEEKGALIGRSNALIELMLDPLGMTLLDLLQKR